MFEFVRDLYSGENILPGSDDLVILLHRKDMILSFSAGTGNFPALKEISGLFPADTVMPLIGFLNGQRCFAVEISELPLQLPENLQLFPIRKFLFEYPTAPRHRF